MDPKRVDILFILQLLATVSLAIPFLAVRDVYSICSAFSTIPSFGPDGPAKATGGLSAFNIISGKWEVYLVMSFLMELVVVLLYLGYGLTHRKVEDEIQDERKQYELGGPNTTGDYRQPSRPYVQA